LKETATASATRSAQRESYMLDLMTDASQDMAGMLLLSFYFLDVFSVSLLVLHCFFNLGLLQLAKSNDSDFWADGDRTRRIVKFQDQAAQVQDFLDFCTSTLAIVHNAMFPRNSQPDNLPELMGKFKDVRSIHDIVKAQMVTGGKLALIWLKICHSKLDFGKVVDTFYLKASKRRTKFYKHDASPVAEKMVDGLLRVDTALFKEFRYDDST
jgi:hypothetical protein